MISSINNSVSSLKQHFISKNRSSTFKGHENTGLLKLQPQLTQDSVSFTGSGFINPFEFSNNIDPVVAEKIDNIEKDVQALGVKTDFEKTNLELANVIKKAIQDLSKAGFNLPDKVVTESEIFLPYLKKGLPATGFFNFIDPARPQDNRIIYNSLLNWDIAIDKKPPIHHVYHEIGHYLHFKSNPENYLMFVKTAKQYQFKDELKEKIQKQVSLKATENIVEFVAEVFAGLMQGKIYDQEIMHFYNGFGGQSPQKGWN